MQQIIVRDYVAIGARAFAILFFATEAAAEIAPQYREMWEKSQVFSPKPSFDTTPVTIKVVSVTYQIPRNYLTDIGPQLPAIKLAWPGLQPLTKENQDCFGSIARAERAGCASFKFLIMGSGSPGGRSLSNAEKFANWQKSFPKLGTRAGPFGYEVHSVGPEEARIEIYRRVEDDILFSCSFSGDADRKRGGLCRDQFRLDDMNHLHFYFRSYLIERVADIEARMRKLMASFVVHRD